MDTENYIFFHSDIYCYRLYLDINFCCSLLTVASYLTRPLSNKSTILKSYFSTDYSIYYSCRTRLDNGGDTVKNKATISDCNKN